MGIKSSGFGGVTQAQLDLVAAKLNLNRVKLPTPSASDYVTPSAVSALSETEGTILEDFEEVAPDTWVYTELDTNTKLSCGRVTDFIKHGSYNWYFTSSGNDVSPEGDYCQIAKTLDLTGYNMLKLYFEQTAISTNLKAEILIGGVSKWEHTFTGAEIVTAIIDTSAISGEQEVIIKQTFLAEVYSQLHFDLLVCDDYASGDTLDETTTSSWRPDPANEASAWCRWDMAALKICSGCRIYWGADAAYRPTAYRIEVSEDGAAWTTVKTETEAASASAWKEYAWNARYARYIRLIVDTHGATGTEIYEADYYSRILDRVASEHGHGSGVTPHLKGHGVRKGFTIRDALKAKPVLTPAEIVDYIDFMLGE